MILLMHVRRMERDPETEDSIWVEVKEGIRYVRQRTWIWAALAGAFISLLCVWGPWETLVPYVVKNDLHGSAKDLGLGVRRGRRRVGPRGHRDGAGGGLPRKALTLLYLAWALGMLMTAGFGVIDTVWQGMIVAFVVRGLDHGPRHRVGDGAAAAGARASSSGVSPAWTG